MCNWNSIHLSLCAVGWNIILSHKGGENSKLHSSYLHCLMLVPGLLVFHCDPVTFGTHRNSLQMTSGLGRENHSTSTFSCFGSVLVNFFFLIWYKPGPTSQDHLGRGNLNWKKCVHHIGSWAVLWGIVGLSVGNKQLMWEDSAHPWAGVLCGIWKQADQTLKEQVNK